MAVYINNEMPVHLRQHMLQNRPELPHDILRIFEKIILRVFANKNFISLIKIRYVILAIPKEYVNSIPKTHLEFQTTEISLKYKF